MTTQKNIYLLFFLLEKKIFFEMISPRVVVYNDKFTGTFFLSDIYIFNLV